MLSATSEVRSLALNLPTQTHNNLELLTPWSDFTVEDEGYVTSFLEVAGQIIEKSQIFQHQKKIVSEFEKLQVAKASKSHDHMSVMQATVIEEGDEEEEEDDDDDD